MKHYEVVNLGCEHPDYFQGFGCAFTGFTGAVVGIGMNAAEAYEDACLQAEELWKDKLDGWSFPKRFTGIRKTMRVPKDCTEMYWYVGIRFGCKPNS